MKSHAIVLLSLAFIPGWSPFLVAQQTEENNKARARRFYEELWMKPNLGVVDELVASEYVVHDLGERKAVTETAADQARTADFFWQNGEMSAKIDFQIAEGDLVATRWLWDYQPRTWWMRALWWRTRNPLPIINVFRFEEGKIVEIWNHRHDIDTGWGNILRLQGFATGFSFAGILGLAWVFWRKWRESRAAPES